MELRWRCLFTSKYIRMLSLTYLGFSACLPHMVIISQLPHLNMTFALLKESNRVHFPRLAAAAPLPMQLGLRSEADCSWQYRMWVTWQCVNATCPFNSLVSPLSITTHRTSCIMNILNTSPLLSLLIAIAATSLWILYKAILPKPIPGIPYNKDAANKLFGDVPEMMRYVLRTKRIFVSRLSSRCISY